MERAVKKFQDSISKPPGDQHIIQNLRETIFLDTLYKPAFIYFGV